MDILDIKGPEPALLPLPLFVAGTVFLVLLAIAWLFVFYTRQRRHRQRSARSLVMEGLRRISEKNLSGQLLARDYFDDLSGMVRQYLDSRHRLESVAMSTEEFLERAAGIEELTAGQKKRLGELLVLCDLVRFAGYMPSAEESFWSYNTAMEIVGPSRSEEAG